MKTLTVFLLFSSFLLLGCVENPGFEEYKALAQKSVNSNYKITFTTTSRIDSRSLETWTMYHKGMKTRTDVIRGSETIRYYGYEDLEKKLRISCMSTNSCKKTPLTKEEVEIRTSIDKFLQLAADQNLRFSASYAYDKDILGIPAKCFRVSTTRKDDVIQQIFPDSTISCLDPNTGVELYGEEGNRVATYFSTTVSDEDLKEPEITEIG